MIFAYFGPETVLPLTSVLAAVTGVALMFGRQVRLVGKIVLNKVLRKLRGDRKSQAMALSRAGRRIDRANPESNPPLNASPTADIAAKQVQL